MRELLLLPDESLTHLESRSGLTAGPQARPPPAQAGAALGGDCPPFTSEREEPSLWLRAQALVPLREESSSPANGCEPGGPHAGLCQPLADKIQDTQFNVNSR